jgi:capsular polysaccharide biosynthesis protein
LHDGVKRTTATKCKQRVTVQALNGYRKMIRRHHVEGKEPKEVKEPKTGNVQIQQRRNNGTTEIDLVKLLLVFRRHLLLIIFCFAIGLAAAGSYSYYCITPLYQATAKLYMVSASNDSIINLSDLNLGSTLSEDYKELLKTRPVILSVIENLGLEGTYNYDGMCNMISISTGSSSRILKIMVTSADPKLAEQIANCLAEKAVEYLPEVMETTAPNIAEQAIVPTTKISPNITGNALKGGMVGTFLCMGILVIIYLLDDTLKDAEDVEHYFGVMPLAVIPEGHMGKSQSKKKKKKT